jgi:hypothetical protein
MAAPMKEAILLLVTLVLPTNQNMCDQVRKRMTLDHVFGGLWGTFMLVHAYLIPQHTILSGPPLDSMSFSWTQ